MVIVQDIFVNVVKDKDNFIIIIFGNMPVK